MEVRMNSTKGRGRSRKNWTDDVKVRSKSKNFDEVKQNIKDRDGWRTMVVNL